MRPALLLVLAPAVASLVLLASCRDFHVPPEFHGPVPMGTGCTASAECVTDLCADGFCCERACAEDEVCDAAGLEGRCTPRPPGRACERAAQCPGGRCLHTATSSFCYEDGCAADERYDLAGSEGTCTPRPPGYPCEAPEQCPGGRCFHPSGGGAAFCCDRDCATDESCEVPGHEGTCTERPPGTPCTEAPQCPTGLCVAGAGGKSLCCEQACAATERCDAPGREGACTPRVLGDPCQADGDCPLGHCAQGVCCDTACEEDCKSCVLGGSRGTCTGVAENTDPKDRCGLCGACIRGFCGAALANSAPKEDCGKGSDKVCSASQTCGFKTGSACARDSDCAAGACVLSRCFVSDCELVYPQPIDLPTVEVGLVGLAVDTSDVLAVGVASLHEYPGPVGTVRDPNQYTTLIHGPDGWAHALNVDQDCDQGCTRMAGSMAFWSGRLYQAQYQPCTAATGCGLVGQLFGNDLQAGNREQISAPDAIVRASFVLSDERQRLWAVWSDLMSTPELLHVARRETHDDAPPSWAEQWSTPDPNPGMSRLAWGAEVVGDDLYVATLTEDPVAGPVVTLFHGPPATVASQRPLPGPCSVGSKGVGLDVGGFGTGDGRGLAIAVTCWPDGAYGFTWTPGASQPWQDVALPASTSALAVRNAELPAFVLFDLVGKLNDLVLYWKVPSDATSWSSRLAFEGMLAAAPATVQAAAASDGAPVLSVSTAEVWQSSVAMPTSVQVVRFHR